MISTKCITSHEGYWVQQQLLVAAWCCCHLPGVVYAQPDVEVLRNNLQLAQTGLVVVTALGNLVLTLARGEERAESLMRDMPGIVFAACFPIFLGSQANISVDAAVHLNVVLRVPRHAIPWKISDRPFNERIGPTKIYTVLMLSGVNAEHRAVLAARWLWYNFNADVFLLSPARMSKLRGNSMCGNCLFYEVHNEVEQWLAGNFASVFGVFVVGDKEYLRLPCRGCNESSNSKCSFRREADSASAEGFPDTDLLILPNTRVLDPYEWIGILRDLVVINDEVGRGAVGLTSKQLLDGLQNTSTQREATHTRKILLGIFIECVVSLLLCAYIKIVPYFSTVIARRLVRSIVTGKTSKTAMIMPPGDMVYLIEYEDGFPGLRYTCSTGVRSYQNRIEDITYPLLMASLYLLTLISNNMLWALSLGGYIPALVGEKGRVQPTIFNLTAVVISLCIWLLGINWRLWKGMIPSSMGPLLTDEAPCRIRFILQLLSCILVSVLVAFLAVCYAAEITSSDAKFVRAIHLHFWIICACCSLLANIGFCFIDSVYFLRTTNTLVPEYGASTTFQCAHILSQVSLSLITGNIF